MRVIETAVAEMPTQVLAVAAAEVVAPHTLRIAFTTGEQRTVDFGPFLRRATHPSIQAYLEKEKFCQFAIVNGNVNWNDYDLIFPLAALHDGAIS